LISIDFDTRRAGGHIIIVGDCSNLISCFLDLWSFATMMLEKTMQYDARWNLPVIYQKGDDEDDGSSQVGQSIRSAPDLESSQNQCSWTYIRDEVW
jgi:hypothetical protein